MMRTFLLSLLLLPILSSAQDRPKPFELRNQNGSHFLVSIPPSDSAKALTVVFSKKDTAELYRFPLFLDNHVGLSNDGRKIINYLSELPFAPKDAQSNDSTAAAFFVDGIMKGIVPLGPIISHRLNELPKKEGQYHGWVENDSIIHQMALNPFYVDEDKVFISTSPMKLNAFDLNSFQLLYYGPGRAHFTENYYSIPLAPYREVLMAEALEKLMDKTQK